MDQNNQVIQNDQNNGKDHKFPCGLVRDLIPLYHDNICGDESRKIVEEHISECSDCAGLLGQLSSPSIEELEEKLTAETSVILEKHRKKEKRTAVTAGTITAGILIIPVIVCLIVNLASGHGLSWFYIVLTSLMTVASVTVVPMLAGEHKFAKTVISFTISAAYLLLSCRLVAGGDWLIIAEVSMIFGISLFFAPFVIRDLPLPAGLKNRKFLTVFLWDFIWLAATLAVCCIQTGGDWFWTVFISCMLGLSIAFLPALIRQIPLPDFLKNHKALLVMLWDTAWLYILLLFCGRYVEPSGSCLNSMQDLYDYYRNSILIATACLPVPWMILILMRYTKLPALVKTGLCVLIPPLFGLFADDIILFICQPTGYQQSLFRRMLDVMTHKATADTGFMAVSIVFSSLISAGIIFITAGVMIWAHRRSKK